MLKVATWNVNGIRARGAQVLEWIERERPDVICLQELKSTVAQVPAALCELQGYRCYWHLPPLYNPDNFRKHQQDIFNNVVSVNMLCLPEGDTLDVGKLRPVSGPDDNWRQPKS